MRATLIHNPSAGDGKPDRADIERILAEAGFQVRYQSTKKDWKKALKEDADLIIAAGGDGTIAKVLRASAGSDRPVAVLPIGTANNISRTAAALGDARELVKGWRNAKPQAFDVWVARGSQGQRTFVEGAGGGVFADTIAEGKKHVENAASIVGSETDRALAFLRDRVTKAKPTKWNLVIDGVDFSDDYLAVEAMNIRHAGPSVPIAPGADPRDGLLDVVLIRPNDSDGLLDYLDQRLHQHEVALPNLTVQRGSRVELRPSAGRLRVDDALINDRGGLEISISAAAARVLHART